MIWCIVVDCLLSSVHSWYRSYTTDFSARPVHDHWLLSSSSSSGGIKSCIDKTVLKHKLVRLDQFTWTQCPVTAVSMNNTCKRVPFPLFKQLSLFERECLNSIATIFSFHFSSSHKHTYSRIRFLFVFAIQSCNVVFLLLLVIEMENISNKTLCLVKLSTQPWFRILSGTTAELIQPLRSDWTVIMLCHWACKIWILINTHDVIIYILWNLTKYDDLKMQHCFLQI